MKMASAWSTDSDTRRAVHGAYEKLRTKLGAEPSFLVVTGASDYDWNLIAAEVRRLAPKTPVFGGTSCQGVMTEQGYHAEAGYGLGFLGFLDPTGAYGVGAAPLGKNPRAAAAQAARAALAQAKRPGQVPAMSFIMTVVTQEERLIQGVEDVFGPNVPIMGGSAGDNRVVGEWKELANDQVLGDGVAVAVLFPSTDVMFAFHSGFEPTGTVGKVTRLESERVIREINGRPAAQVYDEWTGGAFKDVLTKGGDVLARSIMHPFGRVVSAVGGVPYFQLTPAGAIRPDGALTVFTNMAVGDELTLMQGTQESLVSRAARTAKSALEIFSASPDNVAGAFVVFCAGCMMTLPGRMPEAVTGLAKELPGRPLLGAFTLGEQGCFIGGENRHGNLMISVVMFGKE